MIPAVLGLLVASAIAVSVVRVSVALRDDAEREAELDGWAFANLS
ncbi:hypothetical protein NQ152_11955 [Microbacterium sp. zg.B48]|nr:hypothetical protein [Microbacterium sp. zg.B48]MCR2764217.1 hypothetical protein [Microbacterium sp. zg.B48]